MPNTYIPYNPAQGYTRDYSDLGFSNVTGMRQPRTVAPPPSANFTMPPMPTAARPSASYNPMGMSAYRGVGGRTAPGTPLPAGVGTNQGQMASQIQQLVKAGLLSPAMKEYVLSPISSGRGRFAGSDWQGEIMSRLSSTTGIAPGQLPGVLGVAGAHGSTAADVSRSVGFNPAPAPDYRGYGAPSQYGGGDYSGAMQTTPGFAGAGAYSPASGGGGGGMPWQASVNQPGKDWASLSSVLGQAANPGEPDWIAKLRQKGVVGSAPIASSTPITGARAGVLPGRSGTTTGYNSETPGFDMASLFE